MRAKRLNCNIVAMIWEDKAYGLIQWKQDNEFGRHTDLSFGNPDWKLLGESFGWHAHIVSKSIDLRQELIKAFDETEPSLIVIPIDYSENAKLSGRLGNIACPI